MLKTYYKTILIAIFAVVLFGCGGEADETRKLGFAGADEMKESHAKGWHTQQQYYKDNPDIARKAEEKLASERKLAEQKAAEEKVNAAKKLAEEKAKEEKSTADKANLKYTRTKEDVALQCHYKDPRSANSWIYLIDSDKNEVNKLFNIKDGKIDVSHNIDRKHVTGSEIVFDVTSINTMIVRKLSPGNIDASDYEKFTISRSTLDMDNEVLMKKLSSYPSNYQFVCRLMDAEMYTKLIDNIMDKRAANKAKEANNKL